MQPVAARCKPSKLYLFIYLFIYFIACLFIPPRVEVGLVFHHLSTDVIPPPNLISRELA